MDSRVGSGGSVPNKPLTTLRALERLSVALEEALQAPRRGVFVCIGAGKEGGPLRGP